MRSKKSVLLAVGLIVGLNTVAYAERDLELDRLMLLETKPRVKAKPQHKVVKKHHHAKKVKVESEVYAEPAPAIEQAAPVAPAVVKSEKIAAKPQVEPETQPQQPSEPVIQSTSQPVPVIEQAATVTSAVMESEKIEPEPKVEPEITRQQPATPVTQSTQQPTEEWQTIDRYQVKGGLVKDTVTGLIWMRCSLGQEWDGSTCQGTAKEYKWDEAVKIANEFEYAGFNDWHVPTIQELKSLVYCSSGQPKTWLRDVDPEYLGCKGDYIKPTIKNEVFLNASANWFWSSSPVAGNSNYRWLVDFDSSYDDQYGGHKKLTNYAVRLVRTKR
jgi:hypothetical protein